MGLFSMTGLYAFFVYYGNCTLIRFMILNIFSRSVLRLFPFPMVPFEAQVFNHAEVQFTLNFRCRADFWYRT